MGLPRTRVQAEGHLMTEVDAHEVVIPREVFRHTVGNSHCGMCVYPSDIGVPGRDEPAYVNPTCPEHGDEPSHEYQEVRVHQLHDGPMGVCECGAYRDDHASTTTRNPRTPGEETTTHDEPLNRWYTTPHERLCTCGATGNGECVVTS